MDPLNRSVTEALRSWRIQHDAGISIPESLALAAQLCGADARGCFERAAALAADGADINGVLSAMDSILPEGERAVIASGWLAGRAEAALDLVVAQRTLWYDARKRIYSKLLLPALTLLLASFVAPLPGLALERYGVPMYCMLATAPLGIALGVCIFGVLFFRKRALEQLWNADGSPKPASTFDRAMLKIPLAGHIELQRSLAEFGSLLSNLLAAGVPITRGLQIAARAMRNGLYRESVSRLSDQTALGRGFTVSLRADSHALWPNEFCAAVDVGERSGTLDESLARLAGVSREKYTRAIEQAAEWLPRIAYGIIAIFMIVMIFVMAFGYFNMLNDLMKNAP